MMDDAVEKLAVALSALCTYDEMAIYVSKLLEAARNEGAAGAFGAATGHTADFFQKVPGDGYWISCGCGKNIFAGVDGEDWSQWCEHIRSLAPAQATAWLDEHDKQLREKWERDRMGPAVDAASPERST